MGNSYGETKWSDMDDSIARASRMVTMLMHVSSLERIENVDAYVGSIEMIVFDLIARHVESGARATARTAYKRGLSMGLRRSDQSASRDAFQERFGLCRDHAAPFLAAISAAGAAHGRMIRLEIARRQVVAGG